MSPETDDPNGTSRREFLLKVGMYGAPTILVGGAMLDTAVRASAASEGSAPSGESSGPPTESSGGTPPPTESSGTGGSSGTPPPTESSGTGGSSSSPPPSPATPLQTIQAALASLKGLTAPQNALTKLELADAIAALGLATQSSNWVNGSTLAQSRGVAVYAELAGAALALTLIQSPPATVTTVLSELLTASATLASTAIKNATGASSLRLSTANKAFAAGVAAGARGQYVVAVVAYGEAWAAVAS